MHGGTSPGAPKGVRNGSYRHGRYTVEAIAERRALAAFLRECREQLGALKRQVIE